MRKETTSHPVQAMVTGGSSGIGAALVAELVSRGLRVYSVARSAEKLTAQAASLDPRVQPVVADVARPSDWKKIAQSVEGPLDFLVHNAGTLDPVGPVEGLSREDFHRNFTVNAEPVLFLTQWLLPVLRQPGARILAVSSGAAYRAIPGWAAYCTSKAALNMMVQVLEAEWGYSRGIHAAVVRPGVVDTPMQAHIRQQDERHFPLVHKFRAMKQENTLARPEEVARFMADVLLCTTDADFGQTAWDFYQKSELAHKMENC